MSAPMTAAEWKAALRKFDQPFVDQLEPGRDGPTGLDFGPVHGFLIHHTGDDAADSADSRVISDGRSDLPGPLAHGGCRDDGVIELKTTGRANHAGYGDHNVFNAVLNESYGKYPPKPNRDNETMDGNDPFYGLEIYWSGQGRPTIKQYHAAVNWAAAICWHHGWSAKSGIGHKEWTSRKIDPGFDMATFRADVADRLASVQKPTRISRFLDGGSPYNMRLLDDAVAGGRRGRVRQVRNKINRLIRELPHDRNPKSRVNRVRNAYQDNRLLRLGLLNQAVRGGRTGLVEEIRDEIRDQIRRLPRR